MVRLTILAIVLAAGVASAAASDALPGPSSNLLFQLQKQNRSRPWLRVTTDSTRLELKAQHIDERGLRQLSSRGDAPLPVDLSWSRIGRIDEVVTRRKEWGLVGAITLGLAGAGLGNALGAPDHQGGKLALLGLATFGSAGGWLGGRYGERFKRERNWYVAVAPLRSEPEVAFADTASRPETEPAIAPAEATMSTSARRIAERIDRNDALRLSGAFGRFQGFARVVGPQGFEGLRRDRKAHGEWAAAAPPEPVAWDTIDEVQMRGGSALRGALVGGLIFAAIGGLFGAAAVSVAQSDATAAEGLAAGAAICAPVGAALGGAMGLGVRRWVVVYR